MQGRVEMGRGESKSLNPSPPRPAPWCGAKILPLSHSHPTTFAGWGKPARGKAESGELSGARQNCHPYSLVLQHVL